MPGLLWNMMMSMVGGLVFPGRGRSDFGGRPGYQAARHWRLYRGGDRGRERARNCAGDRRHVRPASCSTTRCFFRPLLAWADNSRFEESQGEDAQSSWLLDWGRRSRWFPRADRPHVGCAAPCARLVSALRPHAPSEAARASRLTPWLARGWDGLLLIGAALALVRVFIFLHSDVGWAELAHVTGLGLITLPARDAAHCARFPGVGAGGGLDRLAAGLFAAGAGGGAVSWRPSRST